MSLSTSDPQQKPAKCRKFMSYMSLTVALRKQGYLKPGKMATILLECFLHDKGRLHAVTVVSKGLCEDGRFAAWRDRMVSDGWILWSRKQVDKGKYEPGVKLIPYLNREKFHNLEIMTRDDVLLKDEAASRDDVHELRSKHKILEARMEKIEMLVSELRVAIAPPDSEEKKAVRERVVGELSSISSTVLN